MNPIPLKSLPLDLSKLKTIAVIGPNAADVHTGGYTRDPMFGISVLDLEPANIAHYAHDIAKVQFL